MNYHIISRLLGVLLIVLSGAMSTSIFFSELFNERDTTYALLNAVFITLTAGGILFFIGRRYAHATISRREALVVVSLSWILIGVFGALPYLYDGVFFRYGLFHNYTDAFFETISGFTTTGSTVLDPVLTTEIEKLSHGLHYWRSLTHWLGGMGIIVLFIAIFPQLGVGAKHLFRSEVPGPITEGLKPKIKETSTVLWRIYVGLTLIEFLILISPVCDMGWFDALCHSFATMATGGFSTKNGSVADFNSVSIDLVITLFMFLAGVNFSLYYVALTRRSPLAIFKDTEFRTYLGIVVAATVLVALNIWEFRHENLFQAFRHAAFQVTAMITTTGFGTDDFDLYPTFSKLLLVCLMFIGGSAGSTAGGIKVSRIIVLIKAAHYEIYKTFRPQRVISVKINNSTIPDDIIRSIFGFFVIAITTFVGGSLFMTLFDYDLATATTAVAATLFNIGPGLSQVGATMNFAFIPPIGKLFLSFCMILGRLEFYTLLVLIVPDFWRR